jgi:hypothetical protein
VNRARDVDLTRARSPRVFLIALGPERGASSRSAVRADLEARRRVGAPLGKEQIARRIESLLAASKGWTGGKQRLRVTRLRDVLESADRQVGPSLVKASVAEWAAAGGLRAAGPCDGVKSSMATSSTGLVDREGARGKAELFPCG